MKTFRSFGNIDRMIAETYMDGGALVNTTIVFPQEPYTTATLLGKGRMSIGNPV